MGVGEGDFHRSHLTRSIGRHCARHDHRPTGGAERTVYRITTPRPDIDLREHGAVINSRMGLVSYAAFAGTDADAMVAGDVAMLEREVTPVVKALCSNRMNVVAIHDHMTGVTLVMVYLHYYGTGPAAELAQAVRSAVDLLGKTQSDKQR